MTNVMLFCCGFSTLRRVYRWCNLASAEAGSSTERVSVPSDGSTGGVTQSSRRKSLLLCRFQYPQTGLQVV